MSYHVKEFTEENFADEVLSSAIPVVVDFWAEWCGPCKMFLPIIHELAEEYDGRVTIGKLNIDSNSRVASKYGITTIPTLLFFKNGNIVDQHVGLLAKKQFIVKIDGAFK